MENLDRLTQLTIDFGHMRCRCNAALVLVCPRNLLQLEISNHSFSAHDGLAIDRVCSRVIARFVALDFASRADLSGLYIWVPQIFQHALSKSPPLEEVKLTHLDLTAIPAPIARLSSLKRVDLSGNKLTGELCGGALA